MQKLGDMDLSTELWMLGRNSCIELCRKLLAYTMWPYDDRRRQSELAALYATVLAEAEDLRNNEKDLVKSIIYDRMLLDVENSFRQKGGGWSALLQPRDYLRLAEAETEIRTAGFILALVYSITKENQNIKGVGTINKVMYIIDITAKETGLPARSKCFESWKAYKSIAHISVGLLAVQQMAIHDERDALMTWLSIARFYQEFAFSGENPIVSRDEMWLVPASIKLPKIEEVLFELKPSMLTALETYRARQ